MKNHTVSCRYRVLLMLVVLVIATGVLPNPVVQETAQAQRAFAPITLNDPTSQAGAGFGNAVSGVGDVGMVTVCRTSSSGRPTRPWAPIMKIRVERSS